MAYAFSHEDVAFLRSAEGVRALAKVNALDLTDASLLSDIGNARKIVGDRFAAATVETVRLRRRAESKMDKVEGWLFTESALQQATAASVARHRARRLVGRDVHDVTCSIGADLAMLSEFARRGVGSDIDHVRLLMAAHNLADKSVVLARADALLPTTRNTAVFADPARRDDAGRRKWQPRDLVPRLDELLDTYAGCDLVVKCAPGANFDLLPSDSELELVSLNGSVREATMWSGGLREQRIRRRATVLDGDSAWSITDAESDDCEYGSVGEWIIDPDGAVVRAGLVRQYAAKNGLWQLDPRIAYLTSDQPPRGVRAFRVLEHFKYRERALRDVLRCNRVGKLEILVRGVDVDPDSLRRRLRLVGELSATVVLCRIGDTPTAFLCQAGVT